jgi:SHAQKYF class myb-like DNA-binding protein
MAISDEVKRQFFARDGETSKVIRLPRVEFANPVGPNRRVGKPWTKEEHERFLEGLQMFPSGPWRRIATHVGTRTSRQTMTHAQKYRKRISRLLVSPVKLQSMASPLRPPSTEPIFEQCVFDDLDLEILSCLLADGEVTSDDSFSSSEESPCDVFEDLLDTAGGDHDMLRILTKLDVGDHHSVVL